MVQRTQAEQMAPIRAEEADQPLLVNSRQDIADLASSKSDIKWLKWILGIFATLTIGGGIAAFFYIMQRFDNIEIYILQRFDNIEIYNLQRFDNIETILLEIVQKLP